MAKQKRVIVNKPMLEALRKMMIRSDNCLLCERELAEHSWFQFTEDGKLVGCSNSEG